jgi:hypothetical protein
MNALAQPNPDERRAKQELAHAYSNMTAMFAWQHFKTNILDRILEQAVTDEDAIDIKDLSSASIGECRGRRNAVKKILREVENILQPF